MKFSLTYSQHSTCKRLHIYKTPATSLLLLLLMLTPVAAHAQEFIQTGIYSGDGSSSQTITGIGFQPDVVIVKSSTNKRAVIRTADMPNGLSKKLTENKILELDRILSLDADGFTVGGHTETNESGREYYWVAMKAMPGVMEVGQYVGDGQYYRSIGVTGLEPDAVLVLSDTRDFPTYRHDDMRPYRSYTFSGDGEMYTGISDLTSNGFEIGEGHKVNESGQDYYYVAWGNEAQVIDSGTYRGDGQASLDVTGLSLDPQWLFIANDSQREFTHRPANLTGNSSLFFDDQSVQNNLILTQWDGGFRLGSDNSVNRWDEDYFWLAFANRPDQADLVVSNSADEQNPAEGETVNLSLVVTNNGPDAITGVQITNLLPAGLTYGSSTPGQGTYNDGSGIWDVGSLGIGASSLLTITTTVDGATGGSILTNTASITAADLPDPNAANNSASVDITVTAPSGNDLLLAMVVDDATPNENQTINYTVSVTNNGPENATGVEITDLLSGDLTFNSATPSIGSYNEISGLWNVGNLDMGQTQTLVLEVNTTFGTGGNVINNSALVTASDLVDPNNTNDSFAVDITVAPVDLRVTKIVSNNSPDENDTVTYTVIVTNQATAPASNVVITDLLPAGIAFQSFSASVGAYNDVSGNWTLGDLAGSATATLSIFVTINNGTGGNTVTNTASLTSLDQTDSNGTNDSSTIDLTVAIPGGVDLQLSKSIDFTSPLIGELVTYSLILVNPGPDDATGIEVLDNLPENVTFVSALTNKGSYDNGTGIWTIGDLNSGYQAVLNIQATVDTEAISKTITNTASIAAVDQTDPDPANNIAHVDFVVSTSDLILTKSVDTATPAVGDTVTYTIDVRNDGPNLATGVEITDLLPEGITFVDAGHLRGSYDDVTGIWNLGGMNPGLATELAIRATVDLVAAGSVISNFTAITTADNADPDTLSNTDSADITIAGADLGLSLEADYTTVNAGNNAVLTLTVTNNGPDAVDTIEVTQLVPAGLSFVSYSASSGTYENSTGEWTVGSLLNTAAASLEITVAAEADSIGRTIINEAAVSAASLPDANVSNNSASVGILVWDEISVEENTIWPLVGSVTEVNPGVVDLQEVLTFALVNRGDQPDTLSTITLQNLTTGTGTPDQMDEEWQNLVLSGELSSAIDESPAYEDVVGSFSSGVAEFNDLDWYIPAGDTLTVIVSSGASLRARDSAMLRTAILDSSGLVLTSAYNLIGNYPLFSGQALEVNGFVAKQAAIIQQNIEGQDESGLLAVGSEDNLALTVDLPGNGYLPDTLFGLSIKNNGTAMPGEDISGMKVWSDTGNGTFGPEDVELGSAVYSGERWIIAGLSAPVPATGQRFFVTVDIGELASGLSTIRLSLPVGNDNAVEMFSGNDGPVDQSLENPETLGISTTDRIVVRSEWFNSGIVLPGAKDKLLSQILLTNTYTDSRQLHSLTFTNTSEFSGAATTELDTIFQQVYLRASDEDNIGSFDLNDPPLASGIFHEGEVLFDGLDMTLLNNVGTRLFVTADIGLFTAPDGAIISVEINKMSDINIPQSSIVADWPVQQSDTEWLVNGMVAEQITQHDISILTLGPGEGPILAMDVTVPANGFADDELLGITFSNAGSASTGDLEKAELWIDGGNGRFDAGQDDEEDDPADDELLGPLTVNGRSWSSTVLNSAIPSEGSRLFASLTVSETPRDSVTVNLNILNGGITVSSGNDGPIVGTVQSSGTLVISTSPLLTSVVFDSQATNTGQAGTISMTVRNGGSETVTNILPFLQFASGADLLVAEVPSPATIESLDPGNEAVFTWSYMSVSAGEVIMEGNVQGLINGDQVRRSVTTQTTAHQIHIPVPNLQLFATANLPFSINRGQQGLVPLTLTFINPGGDDVADAELSSIRLRFMESEEGPGIIPSTLLDRIIVSEGTNVYLEQSDLPSSGEEVLLEFTNPAVITGSEPVTLGIRLDLDLNSTVPAFLVSIEEAGWLVGNDAVNDANLTTVSGNVDVEFPIRTGNATLVAPASGLNVAVSTQESQMSVPGSTDVQLTEIVMSQSLDGDNSSTIEVGQLAFVFHDLNGLPISDPTQYFSRLSLHSSFQEHYSGMPEIEADSLLVLQLAAPLTISGSASPTIRLMGDIVENAPQMRITPILGSVDYIDARDGNMNNPVPVTIITPSAGPELHIVQPAVALNASGTGSLPTLVSRGLRNLAAMDIVLSNPASEGTSATTCDTIVLEFFNASRQPLDPGPYLDRLRIMSGTEVLGMLVDPSSATGTIVVPMTAINLAWGQSINLQVLLDLKSASTEGSLEVVLNAEGLRARDLITETPLLIMAAPGTSLPISSGVTNIVAVADELQVGATSLMPPLLAPQDSGCQVLSIALTNPANEGSGAIAINSLTLVQDVDHRNKTNTPQLGQLLESITLCKDETIIASTNNLSVDATSVVLAPDETLVINANNTVVLVVEIYIKEGAPPGSLKLVLQEDGIIATPLGGTGSPIRVLPVSGQTFPMVTESGNVKSATLAESYINFPNPFAAGREETTFAFSLSSDAVVSLRVMTPHGELVATILKDEPRSAGFHQSDTWLGLNGNGSAIHNGVYLAELIVQFGDGTKERILRKVAVVR